MDVEKYDWTAAQHLIEIATQQDPGFKRLVAAMSGGYRHHRRIRRLAEEIRTRLGLPEVYEGTILATARMAITRRTLR
jgi:hypothetical protein